LISTRPSFVYDPVVRRARLLPLSFVVAASIACVHGGKSVAPTPTPSAWTQTSDAILSRLFDADPSWPRHLGLHDYDGKVPDVSQTSIDALIATIDDALARVQAFDATKLTPDESLDRAIVLRMLKKHRFDLVDRDEPHTLPQFYESLFGVDDYVERAYAPIADRCKKIVEHEQNALAQVAHVRENLRAPLSKTVVSVASKNFAGYAEYLRGDVAKACAGAGDDAFRKSFDGANEALAKAADALSAWLKDEMLPKGNDAQHVLGDARFGKLLEVQEGLTISIDAFAKMGEDDLAKNKSAYEALAATTKETRPAPQELLGLAAHLKDDAKAFVASKKIVSIPSTDDALVKESPPFQRWNAAFLDASGPFDAYQAAFFYVTLPDPGWPQKEQIEYVPTRGVLAATTAHEVWPGHFLQKLHQDRAPTRLEKMAWSYSFGEGWAHYTEQMMIEEGFEGATPEMKIGQLADALLRDCRFVVAVGVHAKGMTLEQATKRFADDCKQDLATATQQAERSTFDPGYFAYTLGKLEILALRDEAKKALGAKFSLLAFHDALLAHGAPPVALIHDRVLRDLGAL
jgi:uncharacterized protein (DUF885 family)